MNQVTCAHVRVGPTSIGCFDRSGDCAASIRRSSIVAYTAHESRNTNVVVNLSLDNGTTFKITLDRSLGGEYFADRRALLETDLLGES